MLSPLSLFHVHRLGFWHSAALLLLLSVVRLSISSSLVFGLEVEMGANRITDRFLLVGVLVAMMAFSSAYDFYVGGKDGWVLNPSESYSDWAGRNRFQIGDKLVFRYKKGEDSVLVVNKGDYDSCNVSNPIKKFDDGNSVFQFDRSGPFYFISGAPGKCQKGQKLIAVVLAVRNKKPSPSPTASPPPPPPYISPSPKTSISPVPSPFSSPSPSSPVSSPTISPSPAPSTHVSSPSPAPVSSLTPSPSPAPSTHVSSPSPAPVSSLTPAPSPLLTPPPSSPEASPLAPFTAPTTTVAVPPPRPSGTPSGTRNAPGASPTSSSSSPALIISRVSVGLVAMVMGSSLLLG